MHEKHQKPDIQLQCCLAVILMDITSGVCSNYDRYEAQEQTLSLSVVFQLHLWTSGVWSNYDRNEAQYSLSVIYSICQLLVDGKQKLKQDRKSVYS